MANPTTPMSQAASNDLLKAINTLTKAIDGISKSMQPSSAQARRASQSSGARPGASQKNGNVSKREADQQHERNKRLARNQEKQWLDIIGELHMFNKEISQQNKITTKSFKSHAELLKKQNEHAKTLLEGDKMSRKFQDRFVKNMEQMMRSSKAFGGAKLKAGTTGGRIKELLNLQDAASEVKLKVGAAKKRNPGGGMTAAEITGVMKSMAKSGLSADGMTNDEYTAKLRKHDKKIEAKRKALRNFAGASKEVHDANPGKLQKLNEAFKDAAAEKDTFLANTVGKINKSVSAVENFNKSLGRGAITNTLFSVASEQAHKAIEKLGGSGISLFSGMAMVATALIKYSGWVSSLANKQMGGFHFSIQKSAALMGTSTEATIKYLTTMSHQISQFGVKSVTDAFSANKAVIGKLGYFGDEALEFAGKAASTFENMGVTVKDSKAFNKTMGTYVNELNEMSKLTGVSVDEQMAMNNSLIKSQEISSMMMRLNREERAVKVQSIITERNRLIQMGATTEEAQRFIQTLQALNSESPEKRIENAMKIQQLAQMTGMGADGARLATLLQKRPEQLTDSERSYMTDTLKTLGSRSEQLKGGGMANEMLINRLQESLGGGNLSKALKEGAETGLAESNRGKIDPKSDVAKGVSADKQINEYLASILNAISVWHNLIGLPIIGLLGGILAGVTVMAISVGGLDVAKGLLKSGKGKLGGMLQSAKSLLPGAAAATASSGVAGAVGNAAQSVGTGAAGAATGAATKTGAGALAKTAGKSLLKKIPIIGGIAGVGYGINRLIQGDYLGAAGEVASGAASTIPGIGTAASIGMEMALAARDANMANATPVAGNRGAVIPPSDLNQAAQAINNESNDSSSKKDPVSELIESVKTGDEIEQSKLDELIKLLTTLIEAVKPESNGLLDALRSGKGTGISFSELNDKRTLFATK